MDQQHTSNQISDNSQEAITTNMPIFGVKGSSWLLIISNYNVIEGNVVDYMHCVLLGVTKMLLKLWLDIEYVGELWYCGTKVQEAHFKFLQIKPPNVITQVPRSIQQHCFFLESYRLYRSWLLYYSLPVMLTILPVDYIVYQMLLVEVVYTLLQDFIPLMDLIKAECVN